ncbi:MAG TPA: RES family NAD+ phosphorylase [Roseiarcus sp.]|nr:RES family NAD+ phosphorylase [Roseiarcus sp.]
MKLDPEIVRELSIRFQARNYLRVMPKVHSGKPLGMGYGQTRFASPDRSFQLVYLAHDLMTGVAETIVRDRFEDQTDRTLHASEVSDWAASTIAVRSPLIVVDLRTTGLLKLGVTTDASRAKAQETGRLLSQEFYKRFAVDGILYLSRLTAAECIAVYDRAVATKLAASKAVDIVRLRALIPALTALGVTLVDDK